jgi:hypothetical protein
METMCKRYELLMLSLSESAWVLRLSVAHIVLVYSYAGDGGDIIGQRRAERGNFDVH